MRTDSNGKHTFLLILSFDMEANQRKRFLSSGMCDEAALG